MRITHPPLELAVHLSKETKNPLHSNFGFGPLCAQAVQRALRGRGVEERLPGRGYIHQHVVKKGSEDSMCKGPEVRKDGTCEGSCKN